VLGTQVCMGGNYAGFMEDSVFYTSSGTSNCKGEAISAYEWWFEGATVTGSTSADPGYISYSSPGHYITRLKVTSASGGVDYGYRHVSIYNRSDKQPIRNWGMESLSGTRDEGGYSSSIWVREILPNLLENSIVVIFADEEYYGGDKVSIGGNQRNRQKIVFSGYISGDSISYDYQNSVTSFEAESITGIMKEKEGMSFSFDDVTSATKWQHIQGMSMKRAIWEYTKILSTIGEVADVRYIGTDVLLDFFEGAATNLYDSLNPYLQNRISGQMVSDRQGTIFIEPGINITHNATGVYPVALDMQKMDWIDEPTFRLSQFAEVSYTEIGGSKYVGSGLATPYMSNAPGNIAKYSGKAEMGSYDLMVASQTELNQKCGDAFAFLNAKYPEVTFRLAGNYRNLDIAPYEQILVTLNKEDTHRQIVLSKAPFYVEGMNWSFSAEEGSLLPEITLHEITHSLADGQTLPIPQTGDENPGYLPDFPDFGFPNFCAGEGLSEQPYIVITDPELPICEGDIHGAANGAWSTVRGITLYSNSPVTFRVPYGFWYRGSSYDNRTSYTLNAKWYKRDVNSNPIGAWVEDTDDTWYQIYLCDSAGNRLGQAIKDPVIGNGQQRTGVFSLAQGMFVKSMEIALNSDLNPITSVDWSPYTLYTDNQFTYKLTVNGAEIIDYVRRDQNFPFASGYENGSIWTPRAGGGYPDTRWFDVIFDLYTSMWNSSSNPSDYQYLTAWKISDGVTVPVDMPVADRIKHIGTSWSPYYKLGTYSMVWRPTAVPNTRSLTAKSSYRMSGGFDAVSRQKTLISIVVMASHMLVIDSFLLWNVCWGGHT